MCHSATKEFIRVKCNPNVKLKPLRIYCLYAAGFLHSYSAGLLLPKSADDLLQTEDKSHSFSFICPSKQKIPVKYKNRSGKHRDTYIQRNNLDEMGV